MRIRVYETIRPLAQKLMFVVGLLCFPGFVTTLEGQQTDSIAALLASGDLRHRSEGVEWLLSIPTAEWGPGVKGQLVDLLTREGDTLLRGAAAQGEPNEEAGHYHINLVRAALRLDDPATLRGMVTLGIRVSGRAEDYVASRGAEALPELLRGFTMDEGLRLPTIFVVGKILLAEQFLPEESKDIAYAILLSANGYELSYLPEAASFPEFYGAVKWAADSSGSDAERLHAARALPLFAEGSDRSTAVELWRRERVLLAAACKSDVRAHCVSAQNVARAAADHIDGRRWSPARNTINAVIRQVTDACRINEMGGAACSALTSNAQRVLVKLP